jgi:hypothetical protein
MRPHSGKPKLGHKEGRSKLRASSSSAKNKSAERTVSTKKRRDNLDLEELQEKQDELVNDLMEMTEEEEGQVKSDRFAKEFKKLRKKVGAGNDHFNAENANTEMLRAMLTMMLDIIPLAEQTFRKSKKESSAYALNALVNQARELSTDLRMSKDVEGQALFIKDLIITPIFKVFAQQLISETLNVKNTVDTHVSNPKRARKVKEDVDKMARNLGKFLTESVTKMYADVDNYLAGNMDRLIPQKKPTRKTRQS